MNDKIYNPYDSLEIKDLPNEVLATFAYGGLATIAKKRRIAPHMMGKQISNEMLTQLCWDAIRT